MSWREETPSATCASLDPTNCQGEAFGLTAVCPLVFVNWLIITKKKKITVKHDTVKSEWELVLAIGNEAPNPASKSCEPSQASPVQRGIANVPFHWLSCALGLGGPAV